MELIIIVESFIIFVLLIFILSLYFNYSQRDRFYKSRYKELIKNKDVEIQNLKQNAPPSQELSEFLADQARYGFSFLRVDPRSVMIRSPRDN